MGTLYRRGFAWLLARGDGVQDRLYGEHKQALFAELEGVVLEIGPGTGVNLDYLPGGLRWIGIEPNVHLHPYIRRRAAGRPDLEVSLHKATAEALPVADASVDAVIGTLVLCSVDDLRRALAEIRRALKSGGRFLFIEHVAASEGSVRCRYQRLIKPLWRGLADGCRPDRRADHLIETAFSEVHFERFSAGPPLAPVTPHVVGTAWKE